MGNRGGYSPQSQFNMVPITPVVKWLIGINVVIWLVLQVIVEPYILHDQWFTLTFGLKPVLFIEHFFVWQPVTYMFLHSRNVFHILFNMLLLWWLGSELESRWGSRFFLAYYMVSGVGAGLIYGICSLFYTLAFGMSAFWTVPVIGASGAIFGLMLAYGIIFGERVVYFMMVFPMKAKYFVMILGAVEVVTLLNNGVAGSEVANLAHIGGLISGFAFLRLYTKFKQGKWRKKSGTRGRGLKLVVNNDKKKEDKDSGGPRYWN